jgi:hypothetical protein
VRFKGRKFLITFPAPERVRAMIRFVNVPEGHFTNPRTETFRQELRPHLIEVARGRPLSPAAREHLFTRARSVVITPHELAPDGVQLRYNFRGKTPEIYCFDTLQLNNLRQATPTDFPGDLRQCQQCERLYFLADLTPPYTGGKPSPYCGDFCRRKANAGKSTPRVHRHRRRRAALGAAKHK